MSHRGGGIEDSPQAATVSKQSEDPEVSSCSELFCVRKKKTFEASCGNPARPGLRRIKSWRRGLRNTGRTGAHDRKVHDVPVADGR